MKSKGLVTAKRLRVCGWARLTLRLNVDLAARGTLGGPWKRIVKSIKNTSTICRQNVIPIALDNIGSPRDKVNAPFLARYRFFITINPRRQLWEEVIAKRRRSGRE